MGGWGGFAVCARTVCGAPLVVDGEGLAALAPNRAKDGGGGVRVVVEAVGAASA